MVMMELASHDIDQIRIGPESIILVIVLERALLLGILAYAAS